MDYYYKTADSDWYRQRLTGVMFYVIAAFAILLLRLFYLQVVEGEEYRRLSENNCIRLQSLDSPRGLIFDRNGKLLVNNRPSFDLSIVVKDAGVIDDTVMKISRYTGVPVGELKEKIKSKKRRSSYKPILLKRDIGRNSLAAIEVHKFDLPGVLVEIKPIRHYIFKGSASHLLGYLSEINSRELKSGKYSGCRSGDFIGKFGVEKIYEEPMRGRRGGRQVEVNATGQVVSVLKRVDAEPGNNLILTIDSDLQQKAEQMTQSLTSAVVAMEPGTGDILAMASSPSFDQNAFVEGLSHKLWDSLRNDPRRPMTNKVIQGEYPPGSIYKIVAAIAALEEGIIDEEFKTNCSGFYEYGDRVFRCWQKKGHGNVNIVKALAESCDVFFYQVGLKLGVDTLAEYAEKCGLGTRTGVSLEHEEEGLVPTSQWKKRRLGVPWQGGETLSIAIGQGYNLVTPLQMLVLTSAVANGGRRPVPLILKSIVTAEGVVLYTKESRSLGKLPASEKTMGILKRGLWEAVNKTSGTAWRSVHNKSIQISGKTGTSQVVGRKGDDDPSEEENRAEYLKPHAWFTAYAPSSNPEIAVSVIVEHGEHGGSAAGPIAKALIEKYFENRVAGEKTPVAISSNKTGI